MKSIQSLSFPSSLATIVFLFLISSPSFHAAIISDTITSRIINGTADQVFSHLENYCDVYLYAPLEVSFCTTGVPNKPGLVRFVVLKGKPITGENATVVLWEQHQLTSISSKKRTLKLILVDTNRGFPSYDAVFRVLENGEGSQLQWSYNADLGELYTRETFRSNVTFVANAIVDNIELAIASAT